MIKDQDQYLAEMVKKKIIWDPENYKINLKNFKKVRKSNKNRVKVEEEEKIFDVDPLEELEGANLEMFRGTQLPDQNMSH